MSTQDISDLFVFKTSSISDVLVCIDRSGRISIALLVDDHGRLLNTLSDGDVRRGLLAGLRLTDSVEDLLPIKARTPHPLPVTATVGTDEATLLKLMQDKSVRQIPVLAEDGRVTDVVTLSELLPQASEQIQAVVMAGGQGTRLRPLTENLPKPMLPVGGRPLMELIIEQLRQVGVKQVNVATHYQADKIVEHFGDGKAFGVQINYVNEGEPLGTGGALGLMPLSSEPLLVINGDILTDVDFHALFAFHREHRADMTVAVRRYEAQVPYGVIDCDGPAIRGLREKPQFSFFVNAGIYLLNPSVFRHISCKQHMNMTDLIQRVLDAGQVVVGFPICEYWLDIGQHADYQRAQQDAQNGRFLRASTNG